MRLALCDLAANYALQVLSNLDTSIDSVGSLTVFLVPLMMLTVK